MSRDGQNYWNSGYSDIDGLSEYCANNNFGGGDTIGITLYHPEDVINLVQGNVQFGAATQPAQFWEAVGVDEYSTISGLSEAETITSPVLGADGKPSTNTWICLFTLPFYISSIKLRES